jgi:hypothetical protein
MQFTPSGVAPADDRAYPRPYMKAMSKYNKYIVVVPLLALLALSIWFAGSSWVRLAGPAISFYGWLGFTCGAIFLLLVGGGLIALMFYSNRHGYDDITRRDDGPH